MHAPTRSAHTRIAGAAFTLSRSFNKVYGILVLTMATHLEPVVISVHNAPISTVFDVGLFPNGEDETSRRFASTLVDGQLESVSRPDIMRWKYRKLLSNPANIIDAAQGPRERPHPLTLGAVSEGLAVLIRGDASTPWIEVAVVVE